MTSKQFLQNYIKEKLPDLATTSSEYGSDDPWFTNDIRAQPLAEPPYPV